MDDNIWRSAGLAFQPRPRAVHPGDLSTIFMAFTSSESPQVELSAAIDSSVEH